MWLYIVIPQRPHDIYLREAFRKGLRIKVKMAIISMPQKTFVEIAEADNYDKRKNANKKEKYCEKLIWYEWKWQFDKEGQFGEGKWVIGSWQ